MSFTTIVVAAIITLCSGLALGICARELFKLLLGRTRSLESSLRRGHLGLRVEKSQREFIIDDRTFESIIARRADELNRQGIEALDQTTYTAAVIFLTVVSLAGVVAGLSHFT